MSKFNLLVLSFLLSCKTNHEFTMRDETPVNAENAPYIDVRVISKVGNISGTTLPNSDGNVRVNEVGPSKSFLVDFDSDSFKKIIKSSCDQTVSNLKIQRQEQRIAEVAWGGSTKMSINGESTNIFKYIATIEISDGQTYTIACRETN